jgi:hypothetical protein
MVEPTLGVEGKSLPSYSVAVQLRNEFLCGAPFVAMMQPADLRDFDHLA